MEIKALKNLTLDELTEARQLADICQKHDKTNNEVFLDNAKNSIHKINYIFLMYNEGRLVSFLSMYLPTEFEAEITAFTLPEERQKGHFKLLLAKAIKELKKYHVPDLLFACDSRFEPAKAIAEKVGLTYEFSEYKMAFKQEQFETLKSFEKRLEIRIPTRDEMKNVIKLNEVIFGEDFDDVDLVTTEVFKSNRQNYYVAKLKNKTVGVVAVDFQEEGATLFNLGVKAHYSGQGFGKELLLLVMEDLIQRKAKTILVELDSENEIAMSLFEKLGFKIIETKDLYSLKLRWEL